MCRNELHNGDSCRECWPFILAHCRCRCWTDEQQVTFSGEWIFMRSITDEWESCEMPPDGLKIAINYRKFVRPQVVNVDDRSEIVLWSENHIGKCSIEARWKSQLRLCTSEGSCRCRCAWMTTSLCKRSRIKSLALWLMVAQNGMGCEQWLDSLTT